MRADENDVLSHVVRKPFEHGGWRANDAEAHPPYRLTRVDVPGDTSQRWIISVPALGDTQERRLFAKHYSLTSKFRQDVANEFRGLQIAHGAFRSSARFRVPKPYGFDEDQHVILMEYCPSVTLAALLFRRLRWSRFASFSAPRREAFQDFAEAGSLLAEFQAIPANLPPAPQQETLLSHILSRYREPFLRNLEACKAAGLPRVLLDRVCDYVCDRLTIPQRLEIVVQHSDFGPWNVLKGKTYLYLMDFHNFTVGLRSHDAAYFHVALDLWTRFWTVADSDVRHAQGVFLNAFLRETRGADEAPPDSARKQTESLPLFRELRIVHMLYFATIVLSRQRSVRELAYLPVSRRRFLQQWFEREIAE